MRCRHHNSFGREYLLTYAFKLHVVGPLIVSPLSTFSFSLTSLYSVTVEAVMASSRQGASQLFQVLYLGSTQVDRHCSHAVMPWIAEELKLRTEQKIFTWLTPGL